jgi:hypothetical protein
MIASTETQVGDQLLLCAPEEMKWQLQKLSGSSGAAGQNAASAREEPGRSGSPNLLQWEDRSRQQRPNENHSQAEQPNGIGLVEPGTRDIKPAKSWWQRLLSPDPPQPRKTSRETLRGLTAYFWTGGVPVAHDIQDVSPTGLYVVTEERWYPGTVIRMTLTDSTEPTAERSITVNATAMRWGNDGVGLQFVLQDSKNPRQSQTPGVEGVDKKQLDLFMQRLRNGRG